MAGDQSKLSDLTDGDSENSFLSDGGIIIAQSDLAERLDLTIKNLGPLVEKAEENIHLDINGTGVTRADINTIGQSFLSIENTGGTLQEINFLDLVQQKCTEYCQIRSPV